jgi:hypothetical protein
MTRCGWCDEEIETDEDFAVAMHKECALRSVLGSVAHIERRCSCYVDGATETDPPEMTRREAAKAALAAWEAQGHVIPRY